MLEEDVVTASTNPQLYHTTTPLAHHPQEPKQEAVPEGGRMTPRQLRDSKVPSAETDGSESSGKKSVRAKVRAARDGRHPRRPLAVNPPSLPTPRVVRSHFRVHERPHPEYSPVATTNLNQPSPFSCLSPSHTHSLSWSISSVDLRAGLQKAKSKKFSTAQKVRAG